MSRLYQYLLLLLVALNWPGIGRADLVEDVDELDAKRPAVQKGTSSTTPAAAKATAKPATTKQTKGKKQGETPTTKTSAAVTGTPASEEIHYWSNGLQLQKEAGIADLEDNVVVTKGDMRLESQKARIYFKPDTSEIIRVVATGDVHLQKHDASLNKSIRAQGEEAVFYNLEQRVTMRGNARLWRGSDLMKGKQIGYDMNSGIVKVEQVEGVVQPGNKE